MSSTVIIHQSSYQVTVNKGIAIYTYSQAINIEPKKFLTMFYVNFNSITNGGGSTLITPSLEIGMDKDNLYPSTSVYPTASLPFVPTTMSSTAKNGYIIINDNYVQFPWTRIRLSVTNTTSDSNLDYIFTVKTQRRF